MWFKFYHETMAGILQWFESIYLEPQPKQVRVRIDQAEQRFTDRRQQRRQQRRQY